jgi:hypothetical protein
MVNRESMATKPIKKNFKVSTTPIADAIRLVRKFGFNCRMKLLEVGNIKWLLLIDKCQAET